MRRILLSLILFLALPVLPVAAQGAPDGAVLVMSGDLPGQPPGTEITLDMAALQALPVVQFATTTIWTEGEQQFTGVSLRALLDAFGIAQGTVVVTAVNDYSVKIPVSEIREGEAILAYARNGAAMPLRDKGPFWVVYPYDSAENLRNEVIYSRSVWQVARLRIET
ncbi:MAG: molybdopterin-dependent oxidoreductase [Paracoccaceae bacterium]|nr:molybdopterin-dependent oxidoreductase [Paracoccaceae bacterium]